MVCVCGGDFLRGENYDCKEVIHTRTVTQPALARARDVMACLLLWFPSTQTSTKAHRT